MVPPRGSSIRRPPKVCEACRTHSQFVQSPTSNAQPYHSKPRMSLYPSLNLSPGGPSTPPTRSQKAENFGFFAFFSIFLASKTLFEICFQKICKKLRKLRILASQNGLEIQVVSNKFGMGEGRGKPSPGLGDWVDQLIALHALEARGLGGFQWESSDQF